MLKENALGEKCFPNANFDTFIVKNQGIFPTAFNPVPAASN